MLNLFKKNKNLPTDYSSLEVDIHSHLIPGIDDGAPDLGTALELIQDLYNLGYKKLYTTPHVMAELYPNSKEAILGGLQKVRQGITALGIPIEINAAAEYFLDDQFEALLEQGQLLTLPGNHVLVEMSFISQPPNLYHNLFRMQTKGYKPILAHPERYLFLKNDFKQYQRLKEYGCKFQLNLLSLTGYYGKPVKINALKLLKKGMIEYLGTDLHHVDHAVLLKKAIQIRRVRRILKRGDFQNSQLLPPKL